MHSIRREKLNILLEIAIVTTFQFDSIRVTEKNHEVNRKLDRL